MATPLLRLGLATAFACMLLGCAAGPDFQRPAEPTQAGYLSEQELGAPRDQTQAEAVALAQANWWQAFGSAKLNALVDAALAHSPTLASAQATLQQAQFSLQAGEGVFYPEVDANLSVARQRSTPYKLGIGTGTGSIFNLYTLGASISYSLDLFGLQRRTVEGLQAQVDTHRYMAAGSFVTLSSNTVNAAIAHAAYSWQLELLQGIANTQRRQLALAQTQLDAGLIPESTLQAQAQSLAQTQTAQASLAQKLAQTRHVLSLLLGQSTADKLPPLPDMAELHLPGTPPVSVPSDLVKQRPDILQAEAQLHASYAALGVASAQLWPSVSLTAGGGWADTHFKDLGAAQSRFWSVGPSANVALFRGGTLSSQQRAAQAGLLASETTYRQVVLQAFSQVADTLSALHNDASSALAQQNNTQAAQRGWLLAQVSHEAGLINEQQLLTATVANLQAQSSQVQTDAQQLQDAVALYAAMGGQWWQAAPPWIRAANGKPEATQP